MGGGVEELMGGQRERALSVAAPKCTRTQIPLSGRTAGQVSCLLDYGCVLAILLHLRAPVLAKFAESNSQHLIYE